MNGVKNKVAGALPVFLWLEPLSKVPCNIQGTMPLPTVSRTPALTNRAGVGALVQFGGSGTVYYALVIALVLYMQVVRGTKVHASLLCGVLRVA